MRGDPKGSRITSNETRSTKVGAPRGGRPSSNTIVDHRAPTGGRTTRGGTVAGRARATVRLQRQGIPSRLRDGRNAGPTPDHRGIPRRHRKPSLARRRAPSRRNLNRREALRAVKQHYPAQKSSNCRVIPPWATAADPRRPWEVSHSDARAGRRPTLSGSNHSIGGLR